MAIISTSRLIMKPLIKATQRQVNWLRDPEVVRFSEQRHQEHSVSSQLRYITSFPGHLFGVYEAGSGEHIGNVSATHDPGNNIGDVAILIGEKRCWGNGIGSEAWKAFCDWLLEKNAGGFRKLEAGCMKSNEPMLKIIRKSRFVQEGERPMHFVSEGTFVSAMLFGRTK